ncbi:MAG: DNA polymerase III subunit delta [Cytophagaceae bacterium]|nr:DNA polymerase III subunit delta [Cytophagaceae bacterium]MDW8456089.1 DNA polymerase III subunit delta [Cytophagaceae bacterium]
MATTPDTVLKDLKARKYAMVYFLQGDEPYYIDLIAGILEQEVLSEDQKSFNLTIVFGKDTNVSTLLQQAKKFPFMAERQVVIVKEAQELDITKEQNEKMLMAYLEKPVPSTVLVFCYKYKTLDARKALTKTIEKHAVLVNSKKLYDSQLPEWIKMYLFAKGYKAKPEALHMIAEHIGNDLSRIANECDKMLINITPDTVIDDTLVEKNIGISKEYNVFELQKALTQKDVLKANRIIQYFSSNPKNNPLVVILSSLFTFFSKILLVHGSEDKSESKLASLLQINPYFVKDYTSAARAFPISKTISIINDLYEADLKSKGIGNNSTSEAELLKELIYKILH